uniref:PBZ-type domain-containing protein n=1 Tax=Anopheles arabiensis TaxID=7173 RepID=A0A182HYR0_ANOAR
MMKKLVIIDTTKHTQKAVPESGQEIGRGKFLECDDKRVSRTHGRIASELKGSKLLLRLESLHINPIFCRKKDGAIDYTLKKEESILLEIGDKFKLIVDGVWFEVGEDTSETDTHPTEMPIEAENLNSTLDDATPSKRKHDAEQSEDQSKRLRIECADNNSEPSTSSHPLPANHSTDAEEMMVPDSSSTETVTTTPVQIKPDPDALPSGSNSSQVQIKPDPDAKGSNGGPMANDGCLPTGSSLPPVSIKPDPDGLVAKAGLPATVSPVVANPGVLRPSCDFGIRCYRAGQDHRTLYAHPGDLDYRRPNFPPPPPGSPLCPFGARCYRRNPQHFREFDHPDPNADLLRRPLRPGGPRLQQADDNMSDNDEYPYESDPDFDDSSSDEYIPGHMYDESDDGDSAEGDNDSGLDC